MWNQLSSASSANSNRNGHENGHRIAAFRARFGFGPFRWYIFGQVCKIMLDLDGGGQGGGSCISTSNCLTLQSHHL